MSEASDARRTPRWLPRALALAAVTVFVAVWAWHALGELQHLIITVVIAFFISLALEPVVVWLVRHGWRRGLAAGAALGGSILAVVAAVLLFGRLFVEQLLALLGSIPDAYANIQSRLADTFGVALPNLDTAVHDAVAKWGDDITSALIGASASLVSWIFDFTTVLLVVYYLSAAGPRLRATVCRWLTPGHQADVLMLWETGQRKASDYIGSRVVLATLSSTFMFLFLTIMKTPYALPLALFTGVVSQFVPTIGTYIGGALPVAVAWATQGGAVALAIVGFIVVYQQVENFYLSPKVSAHALEMNPAVSFLVVLAFGAVLGPIGAFIALPTAATVQAFASTYMQRYALIESSMLSDPSRAARAEQWTDVATDERHDEPGA
jgi:predicted PurR-regulated permease PerM